MRLAGKGIRRQHTYGHGDHYVNIKIDVPKYVYTVISPVSAAPLVKARISRAQMLLQGALARENAVISEFLLLNAK